MGVEVGGGGVVDDGCFHTLLSHLASKKVAERDPDEARGSRRASSGSNSFSAVRIQTAKPKTKRNLVAAVLRRLADARTPQLRGPTPGMERPEELQPPEEGSGEKPPVMSPNVAVWKMRNTWRCRLIRVLPTIPCERSSCTSEERGGKKNNNFKPKLFQMCVFSVFLVIFSSLPSLSLSLLDRPNSSQGFYSAKADVLIYCGHPSPALIHHRAGC